MSAKVITIDGPSGVGKGTLARLLAKKLNYHLLDSGAIYRLAALQVINRQIDPKDEMALLNAVKQLKIGFKVIDGKTHAYLAKQDVSDKIRQESVGMMASEIASIAEVRAVLLQKQRDFAKLPGLVADGRDMGTVVFPDADKKFFLEANSEVRAKRRYDELIAKGVMADFNEILAQLEKRDTQDKNRKTAPLIAAEDAVIIDTSYLSIEEVFNLMALS
ncbi:(d)CMP kinase [Facilibium subflavum]|uniref:(d)CMP kinase n=1 Tax=Facilibium subflavum TaxID=2219058 RepID=UPI000E6537F4|nr:(d)CMP kinase [Facilibium subflavum]